jgi:hypothetical protein
VIAKHRGHQMIKSQEKNYYDDHAKTKPVHRYHPSDKQ